jgi:hypothetical protein
LQATANKDAALAAQELAAAEEEGKTMVMMFTLLQEQHKAQFKLMVVSNKQAMDVMFKRMNVLIVGHSKAADKENAPPAKSNTGRSFGGTKCNKKEMHALQKTCVSQSCKLLPAQDQCKQALGRMEISQGQQYASLTETGDFE